MRRSAQNRETLETFTDSLTQRTHEDSPESRGGQQERTCRTFFNGKTKDSAQSPANPHHCEGLGHTTQSPAGAAMIFGQRPHAFRASCHGFDTYRPKSPGSSSPPTSSRCSSSTLAPAGATLPGRSKINIRQSTVRYARASAWLCMPANSSMCPDMTRLRSSSFGSIVQTPRSEVPPRMMPSERGIM
jgi:hypothetical protein